MIKYLFVLFIFIYLSNAANIVLNEVKIPKDYYNNEGCKVNIFVSINITQEMTPVNQVSVNNILGQILTQTDSQLLVKVPISFTPGQTVLNLELFNNIGNQFLLLSFYNYICEDPPTSTTHSINQNYLLQVEDPNQIGIKNSFFISLSGYVKYIDLVIYYQTGHFKYTIVSTLTPGIFLIQLMSKLNELDFSETSPTTIHVSFNPSVQVDIFTLTITSFLSQATYSDEITNEISLETLNPLDRMITSYKASDFTGYGYVVYTKNTIPSFSIFKPVFRPVGSYTTYLSMYPLNDINELFLPSAYTKEIFQQNNLGTSIFENIVTESNIPLTPSVWGMNNIETKVYLNKYGINIITENRIYIPRLPISLIAKDFQYKTLPQFPYGIESGTASLNNFTITLLGPNYYSSNTLAYKMYLGSNTFLANVTMALMNIDTDPPVLDGIEFIQIDNTHYVARIKVEDSGSGISRVVFGSKILTPVKNLADGNLFTGYFEAFFSPHEINFGYKYSLLVYDNAFNLNDFSFNYDLPKILTYPAPLSKRLTNPFSISKLEFLPSTAVSKAKSTTMLKLNITDANPSSFKPIFKVILPFQKTTTISSSDYMVWDNNTSQFLLTFSYPSSVFNGYLDYILYIYPYEFGVQSLYSLLGSSVLLNVSQTGDMMAPYIKNLTFQNTKFLTSMSSFTVSLDIDSGLVLFSKGNITFTSPDDPVGYFFTLDSTNFVDSINQYSLLFQRALGCRSQNYTITSLNLIDLHGYESSIEDNNLLNPLFTIINDGLPIGFEYLCDPPAESTSPPAIQNLQVNISNYVVDVCSADRFIEVSFIVNDEDGILIKNFPVIYLTDKFNIVGFNSTFIQQMNSNYIYRTKINIPYGFGYDLFSEFEPIFSKNNNVLRDINIGGPTIDRGVILISIFGITDSQFNMKGYTYNEISNLYINATCSFSPIIHTTSVFYNIGGKLVIHGNRFQDSQTVVLQFSYDNALSWTNQTIFQHTGSILVVNNAKASNNPFLVRVTVGISQSNNYLVVPEIVGTLPPDTTKAPQCKGSPHCGYPLKGECTLYGCQCYTGFVGPDCASTVIVINKPPLNESTPDTVYEADLPDKTNVTYSALVSVYSIREINPTTGKTKFEYIFDEWILTDLSDNTTTKYLYQSNFTAREKPVNVSVLLEWFVDSEVILFANENITMNPSTMKYNINVTSFPFDSQINYLQVIFAASIKSPSTQDSCSNKEFGEVSGLESAEYVKLKINQHSLYGRFIKRAIIDDRILTITNVLLDEQHQTTSSFESSSKIGINIPHYNFQVQLDPDFSILVDSKSNLDQEINGNSKCSFSEIGSKPKLSKNAIIGIAVGGFAFLLLLGCASYYLIFVRYRYSKVSLLILKRFGKSKENNVPI